MLGETLALTCALTWAISVILFRRSEAVSAHAINLFKNVLATLLLGVTVLLWHGTNAWRPGPEDTWRLVVSGLVALALPPEKLRQLAAEAYQLANDLYEAKNVQHDNLWNSMRAYKDVVIHLRTLDPKPDYYDDAIVKYGTCRNEIQERFENNLYQADRAITLRDWEMAVRYLKMIRAQIPDRGDDRNDSARQKLLEAERNLDR